MIVSVESEVLTVAVKQYLFRIHHEFLQQANQNFSNVLSFNVQLIEQQAELFYTDFLCSLEESTVNLAQQASMLAFAESIITVHQSIWCIVVFELSDDKDADHTTPVIVLHPYWNYLVSTAVLPTYDPSQYDPVTNAQGEQTWLIPVVNPSSAYGFVCYNLIDARRTPTYNVQFVDRWIVASIARDTVKGRAQLQMYKCALSPEDYFLSDDDQYVLSLRGTLAATRFPLWKAVIESLPQGHSGYTVDFNGRLFGQTNALSRRSLNGVSNMAQQRRMFIRRSKAVSCVMREWELTALRYMAWMWNNDQNNYQTSFQEWYQSTQGGEGAYITGTAVPWENMSQSLHWIVDFLNLVNVAMGDNGLIITLPGTTEQGREYQYKQVLAKLRGSDGVVRRYAVKEITAHQNIFRHMVDLLAHIIGVLSDFRSALAVIEATPYPPPGPLQLQRANQVVELHNSLALAWPGLVADFYSLLCLHMTWQLTWNPSESTRGTGADDVLRSNKPVYAQKWIRRRRNRKAQPILLPPSMTGRFGAERPVFVPFRTWDVALYDTGYTEALAAEQKAARDAASAAWLAEQDAKRRAREAAATSQRAAYLDAWNAERRRLNEPNPDDLWDYRNFRSYEWWKQKSQEPMNVQFALRAVDVPNELLSYAGAAGGLARNYIPALGRYSDANGWNEKQTPAGAPLERIAYSTVTVLTRTVTGGSPGVQAFEIVGDAAGALADYLGTDDETYSPRQFWPPITFNW
jgi:hypothetical protein